MATLIGGIDFIGKLQEAGIIPKELYITKLILVAVPGEPMVITYETGIDKVTGDFLLDELVAGKDKLIAKRVTERMKP